MHDEGVECTGLVECDVTFKHNGAELARSSLVHDVDAYIKELHQEFAHVRI